METFGSLHRVNLRNIWKHEAHEFTPWLAANITRLGESLGLELEISEREAAVGTFSCDLLAHDVGADRPVIIENQFGSTDHDHLGKLITYAAGLDAEIVIWVGEEIREEHRQALDWLNQHTDSETHFFAVAVEVLRIDDSRPALNFRAVVFPNEWQKVQKRRATTVTSTRAEAYRSYFQLLIDELRERHRFTSARAGQPQNWYSFSAGISGVHYSASFAQGGRARAEVYLGSADGEVNKRIFDALLEHRQGIEQEMGVELDWDRLEGKQAARIAIYRSGSIDDDPDTLSTIREWHIAMLLQFKETVGPRLMQFRNVRQRPTSTAQPDRI